MGTRLSAGDIETRLEAMPGWKSDGRSICRTFEFQDFPEAFAFMTKVARISENLNHHPDWSNSYRRVVIHLTTHAQGGVTELDLEMAEAIDAVIGPRCG